MFVVEKNFRVTLAEPQNNGAKLQRPNDASKDKFANVAVQNTFISGKTEQFLNQLTAQIYQ